MTGYENYNFAEFDKARDYLITLGYDVISPADEDRKLGLDPTKGLAPKGYWESEEVRFAFYRKCMMADLDWVARVDVVYFLRGWEKSRGARAEYTAALFYFELCNGSPGLLFQDGAAVGLQYVPMLGALPE
jgi:hypothetical protein